MPSGVLGQYKSRNGRTLDEYAFGKVVAMGAWALGSTQIVTDERWATGTGANGSWLYTKHGMSLTGCFWLSSTCPGWWA